MSFISFLEQEVTGEALGALGPLQEAALEAIRGETCETWRGKRWRHLPLAMLPWHLSPMNRTQALVDVKAPRFHHFISQGVYEMSMAALSLRFLCGQRCKEMLSAWQSAWCRLLYRCRQATRLLGAAGFVRSALRTSTAALILEALPQELLFPLSSLVVGGDLSTSLAAIENSTVVFTEYFECAQLMGEEFLAHGLRRVSAAEFHGGLAQRLGREHLHRSSVILNVLRDVARPEIVEVGVDSGGLSVELLQSHQGLNWLGVDLYSRVDLYGLKGAQQLVEARAALGAWLGTRAQLLLDYSHTAPRCCPGKQFDLVFIDAEHEMEAVVRDVAAWSPLLRLGGVLMGHDYAKIWPGVIQAVHRSVPANSTLHLAPDMVFWWFKRHQKA